MTEKKMYGMLDNYLVKELDFIKTLPEKNFDCFAMGTGSEGSGKTTIFMSICGFLDPNFNINKIVFTNEQFEEAIENAKVGDAILFDEADVMSDHYYSGRLRVLSKVMKRIRTKRLFIFFVTPTFFDSGKYFAIHRSRFLIHVYTKGTRRGLFRFFAPNKKRELYFKGKRYWNMDAAKASFYGSFGKLPASFPISMDEYEEKKEMATLSLFEDDAPSTKVPDAIAKYRRECIERLDKLIFQKFNTNLFHKDHGFVFGRDRSTISQDMKVIAGEIQV